MNEGPGIISSGETFPGHTRASKRGHIYRADRASGSRLGRERFPPRCQASVGTLPRPWLSAKLEGWSASHLFLVLRGEQKF